MTTAAIKIENLGEQFANAFREELRAMSSLTRKWVSREATDQFKHLALQEAERCANMGSDAHVGYRKHVAQLINKTQGN